MKFLYTRIRHGHPGRSVCFAVFSCACSSWSVTVLVRKKKIKAVQGAAVLLIYIFLFVVFASTVFTRVPTPEPNYELQLFWSYRYVIENRSAGMLERDSAQLYTAAAARGAAAVCAAQADASMDCGSGRTAGLLVYRSMPACVSPGTV